MNDYCDNTIMIDFMDDRTVRHFGLIRLQKRVLTIQEYHRDEQGRASGPKGSEIHCPLTNIRRWRTFPPPWAESS